ncbi:hypothetical protein FRX31_021281 [Thalictrum thalictroides]|uniref:Uncharacterized protein n=1 Tax=Thalictrum thalictroides TaxID=46969 RepID=A0A7J6VWR2_THATH|nr:hypothetical protein FRX31_021281 [Thalictrum thalictroides]
MPKMTQMRFGDEYSSLYDEFERLTFEIQLNQAILRRSFSESNIGSQSFVPKPPALVSQQVRQGRQSTSTTSTGRMPKVLKKLLKPLCASSKKQGKRDDDDHSVLNNPLCWKTFGRSLRVY